MKSAKLSRQRLWETGLKLFWAGAHVALLILGLATVVGFLGNLWWVFDLFSHFRVQYLTGLLALMVVYVLGKRRRGLVLAGVTAALNLVLIAPLYFPVAQPPVSDDGYRLLYANVHTENSHHALTRRLVEQSNPDFVALVEVNQSWLDDLALGKLGYRYSVTIPRDDNFGVALYSRWPLTSSKTIDFSGLGFPSLVAQVETAEGLLTLIVTHPTPPKGAFATQVRNRQMEAVAAYVAALDGEVILAGDLNATSWTPFFWEWQRAMGLSDSRRGFGVQSSWPSFAWFLRVPIDHVLVSSGVSVRQREIGPDIGSDHYPVLLDFVLRY